MFCEFQLPEYSIVREFYRYADKAGKVTLKAWLSNNRSSSFRPPSHPSRISA